MFTRVLQALRVHFDSDVAMLHVAAAYPVTRCGPVVSLGFDTQRMSALADRWCVYVRELDALKRHADRHGPVVQEVDVFSRGQLARQAYHRELAAPEGGLDSVVAYLPWRGCSNAAVMFGSRRKRYSAAARVELAEWVALLALLVAAAPSQPRFYPVDARLTERECQVVSYVEAGLTNAEIAVCLGSSVNTVRNQVASVLRKLQLGSRVELATSGLSSYASHHG